MAVMRNRCAFAAKSPLEAFPCTLNPSSFSVFRQALAVRPGELAERRLQTTLPGTGFRNRLAERERCLQAISARRGVVLQALRGSSRRFSANEPRLAYGRFRWSCA